MRSELTEPLRPVTCDQRDLGERLGVVEERRPPPDSALNWQWRSEGRYCRAAAQVVYERRLLPRHIAIGHGRELDRRRVAGRLPAFGQCLLDAVQAVLRVLGNAHDDLLGAEGLGGQQAAIDHEVG